MMKTGRIDEGMLPVHTQQVAWMLQQALGAPDLLGTLVTSAQDPRGTMLDGKIRAGDVIRRFNRQTILDPCDLARRAVQTPVGSDAALEICRGGVMQTVHVTPGAIPEARPIVLDDDRPRTLGLDLISGQQDNGGQVVKVASVDPTGTIADSGIRKGDVIVEIQETPVSEPDQELHIFQVQSALKHHFAAVLVEHQTKLAWMSLAIPD